VLKHILRHGRRANSSELISGHASSGANQLAALEGVAQRYKTGDPL
jgi:hypothetical protein